MFKPDVADAVTIKPARSAPGPQVDGHYAFETTVAAEHLEAMTTELCSVVLAAGLTLDKADDSQVLAALQVLGLDVATPNFSGIVALATAAQIQAGIDPLKAITPAALKSAGVLQKVTLPDPELIYSAGLTGNSTLAFNDIDLSVYGVPDNAVAVLRFVCEWHGQSPTGTQYSMRQHARRKGSSINISNLGSMVNGGGGRTQVGFMPAYAVSDVDIKLDSDGIFQYGHVAEVTGDPDMSFAIYLLGWHV